MAITRLNNNSASSITTLSAVTSVPNLASLPSGVGGKVVQVQYAQKNGSYSYSGSWHSTAMSHSITPTSSSNKILIQMFLGRVGFSTNNTVAFRLKRDSTLINVGTQIDSRQQITGSVFRISDDGNHTQGMLSMTFIDSPNTTSSVTYMLEAQKETNTTWYLNRNQFYTNNANEYSGIGSSYVYLMELAI